MKDVEREKGNPFRTRDLFRNEIQDKTTALDPELVSKIVALKLKLYDGAVVRVSGMDSNRATGQYWIFINLNREKMKEMIQEISPFPVVVKL